MFDELDVLRTTLILTVLFFWQACHFNYPLPWGFYWEG